MKLPRTLLKFPALVVVCLATGCGSSPGAVETAPDVTADTADFDAEVAPDAQSDGVEDEENREITLKCDFETRDTLDFETGEVRTLVDDTGVPGDLTCFIGRFVGLASPLNVCHVADLASELSDIVLPETCEDRESDAWQTNLLCGLDINGPFEPACINTAIIVRDAESGRLYRLLVVEDFISEERGNGVTFVYEPL